MVGIPTQDGRVQEEQSTLVFGLRPPFHQSVHCPVFPLSGTSIGYHSSSYPARVF